MLKGLKVLDFSYLLPGPLATLMLADMGAEVLKVESPVKIDLVRLAPPFIGEKNPVSYMHAYLNRNKKSLAMDLKKPAALSIIHKLISDKGYDVIIEQYRPGVMTRLGLGYEHLKKIKPDIIYCSVTGYGQTGPLKNRAGHDINYLSLSGVMGYSGSEKSGPSLMGIQVADVTGSHAAVIGILAAVIERRNSGKGRHVDISMTDCMFPYHAVTGLKGLYEDAEPCFASDLLNGGSLYGFYETSDGRYISFGGIEPQFSAAFFTELGLEEFIEGGVMPPGKVEFIREKVAKVILTKPLSYWKERFEKIDACVEPVLTMNEAAKTAHAQARGLIIETTAPDGSKCPQASMPIKLSGFDPEYQWAGCELGRDNEAILASLGYKNDDIAELRAQGLFGIQT
jgi:crotonobetainyl-CoA:carnitine CoA-transferase CaiB-like acyl-CoA transferase